MPLHRKKPFSAKQKKAQILAKRATKREQAAYDDPEWDFRHRPAAEPSAEPSPKPALLPRSDKPWRPAAQPSADGRDKLISQFDKLTRAEIEANKERSMRPLERLSPEAGLTMSFDDAYSADVDIPVRPSWEYGESKEALEARESAYFDAWLAQLRERDPDSVSLYEKNLEVWRQLWRVVEISDILLLIVDIRHPVLHFPPSLYRYVTETTGKPLVVVLNKTDLVAENTVRAWTHCFKSRFPEVVLTRFCCYRDPQRLVNDTNVADMKMRRQRPRRRIHDSRLVGDLFAACRSVCTPDKLGLVSWDELIARYTGADDASDDDNDGSDAEAENDEASDVGSDEDATDEHAHDAARSQHGERVSSKYVTLGFIGHPNVGKSTIINSIVKRTVVSTSRTPGHTKHFQTIHVTPTLRLCDCPGLVFPCVVSRPLQVLAGLYNTAQVQEPYTAVQFLAERVPVERVLNLRPPDSEDVLEDVHYKWSAWAICEAFAIDRGFYTSRGARPDVYRAALYILRWVLDGRILLSFKPPGFFHDFAYLKEPEQPQVSMQSTDSESEASDNSSRPIAQQSAFALLSEENC
ncbi:hypothetical protein IWW54_003928 [Coemansia sp. RSA 2705]|nr:hypothetical protein IWW54_003928 [Coemansia sp. RSA 2705]